MKFSIEGLNILQAINKCVDEINRLNGKVEELTSKKVEFGTLLRCHRLNAGYKQRELSTLLGITTSGYIQAIEVGERFLPNSCFDITCEVLNIVGDDRKEFEKAYLESIKEVE